MARFSFERDVIQDMDKVIIAVIITTIKVTSEFFISNPYEEGLFLNTNTNSIAGINPNKNMADIR